MSSALLITHAQSLGTALEQLPVSYGTRENPDTANAVITHCNDLLACAMQHTPHDSGGGAAATTIEHLRVARRRMWRNIALCDADTLSQMHYARAQTVGFCFGELLFVCAMALTWRICTLQMHNKFSGICANNIAVCNEQRLVQSALADKPIVTYSMGELVDAVQVLRSAFVSCAYSMSLVEYCEMLELAASRMLNEYGSGAVFDVVAMRKADAASNAEIGVYTANDAFITLMWPSFVGMHRRLLIARGYLPQNVDFAHEALSSAEDEQRARALRAWLVDRSNKFDFRDASPSLKRLYPATQMRPGEREMFRLRFPGVTKSDMGVLSEQMGDARFSDINRRINMSPLHLIRDQLAVHPRYESAELALGMHDFVDMLTQAEPGCAWATYYSRPESMAMANAEEVQCNSAEYPMVVQLFNHWQVVYKDHVYWFNSLVYAMCAWLHLLRQQQTQPHTEKPEYCAAARSNIYRQMMDAVFGNVHVAATAAAPPP